MVYNSKETENSHRTMEIFSKLVFSSEKTEKATGHWTNKDRLCQKPPVIDWWHVAVA